MPAPHRNHTCSRCTYSVAGLPARGTCPECGSTYDTIDGVPETLGEAARAFPRRLLIALRDAWPWFADRYVPSFPNAARAGSILIYSAALIIIGALAFDAVTNQFGILRPRFTPRATGPSLFSEMLASTLHWAPLFLAIYAAAVAIQGIARHRIVITPSAVVTGYHARVFGLLALAAAIGLVGVFAWVRVSVP
ncbi:MAG: hypothetical protein Q8L55_13345 [Phycisphaerales bacterium]|nr:hypothetical protein [Phycisphaerales bacterium]